MYKENHSKLYGLFEEILVAVFVSPHLFVDLSHCVASPADKVH